MKALKKVPGDAKGLSKLPTSVRNKMGYMKEGGKVKKGGFEGYEKIASSESSNAIMAKKASHHGKHPKAEYKFTKDKEGKMHMYAKYKEGGKVFKPHKMYKDGKEVMANTMEDHLRYKKKGYTHER